MGDQNTRRRKGNGEAYEAEILTYLNLTQNHIERAKALCDVCSSEETQALRVWMGYAVTLEDQIVLRQEREQEQRKRGPYKKAA